jgi:hypothetical protein
MEKQYRIKGIDDNESVCGVCGKEKLKRVVWLEDMKTLNVFPAGSSCAAKLQKITLTEQKNKESEYLQCVLKNARIELHPFKLKYDSVIESAPNSDTTEKLKNRLVYIYTHPYTKEYENKYIEISNRLKKQGIHFTRYWGVFMGVAHENRVRAFLSRRVDAENLHTLYRPVGEERKRYACLSEHKFRSGQDCKSCSDFRVCWPMAII